MRSLPSRRSARLGKLVVALAALAQACTTYVTIVENDAGGGLDAAQTGPCTTAASCDDGLFCNGADECMPGASGADARGCVHAGSPCSATQRCDEASDRCGTASCETPDADGDQHAAVACGGNDCDDADPNRYPGNPEVCDVDQHDEDCDPATFGVRDGDGDGDPDQACCNVDAAGTSHCGSDCDDTRPGVGPTATETCNGRDDDCDRAVDEGVLLTFYADADVDGYGTSDTSVATMQACSQPSGFVLGHTDCDDTRMSVHPGAAEICDVASPGSPALDENCDTRVNEDCGCTGTGSRPCMGLMGICASGTQSCIGGTWSDCSIAPGAEACDGLDNDCDGSIDEGLLVVCYLDADQDGYAPLGTAAQSPACMGTGGYGGCSVGYTARNPTSAAEADCNDAASAIRPGATEGCNGVDDDCDGAIDNSGDLVQRTVWRDLDNDGYGFGSSFVTSFDRCVTSFPTFAMRGGDCADDVATAFPGQTQYFGTPYAFCAPGLVRCTDSTGTFRCAATVGACATGLPLATTSFDYDCDGVERSQSSTTSRLGAVCAAHPSCGDCVVGATSSSCSSFPRILDFCFTGPAPACGATAPACDCNPIRGACAGTAYAGGATATVICH
ncbi:MAG: putative metal-binding motif-containing protein [Sandaracinus sp.]